MHVDTELKKKKENLKHFPSPRTQKQNMYK